MPRKVTQEYTSSGGGGHPGKYGFIKRQLSMGFLGMAEVSPLLKGSYEPDTEAGQGDMIVLRQNLLSGGHI